MILTAIAVTIERGTPLPVLMTLCAFYTLRRHLPDVLHAFLRAPAAVFWQCIRSCTSVAELLIAIAQIGIGIRLFSWQWDTVRPWMNQDIFSIMSTICPLPLWSVMFCTLGITHVAGLLLQRPHVRIGASLTSLMLFTLFSFLFLTVPSPPLIGVVMPAFAVGSCLCYLGIDPPPLAAEPHDRTT